MGTALTALPYATIKQEAASLGLDWAAMTGLRVVSFADGTAMVVVQEGVHEDAEKLLAHLAGRGLVQRTG